MTISIRAAALKLAVHGIWGDRIEVKKLYREYCSYTGYPQRPCDMRNLPNGETQYQISDSWVTESDLLSEIIQIKKIWSETPPDGGNEQEWSFATAVE